MINRITENFRANFFENNRQFIFIGTLCLFWAIVIYLLLPNIAFFETVNGVGEITPEDVVVQDDSFLVDKEATRLKLEKELKSAPNILDFDPSLGDALAEQTRSIFQHFRKRLSGHDLKIDSLAAEILGEEHAVFQAKATMASLNEDLSFHRNYRKGLANLERLNRDNEAFLTKLGFERQSNSLAAAKAEAALKELEGRLKTSAGMLKIKREELTNVERKRVADNSLAISNLVNTFQIQLAPEEEELFKSRFYSEEVEKELLTILATAYREPLIDSERNSALNPLAETRLIDIKTDKTTALKSLRDIPDLGATQKNLSNFASNLNLGKENAVSPMVLAVLISKIIKPSVTVNTRATENERNQIRESTTSVYTQLKKGETLARRGERLTESKINLIQAYYNSFSPFSHIWRIIGLAVFVALVFAVGSMALLKSTREQSEGRKNVLMMFFSIVVTLFICKNWIFLAGNISISYPRLQVESIHLAIPAVLAPLLVGILINFNAAVFSGLITAAFVSLLLNDNLYTFLLVAGGSVMASFPISKSDSRIGLVKHGIKVGAFSMALSGMLFFINNDGFSEKIFFDMFFAFAGGISASIFAMFLLPFLEYLFDITTDLKLLELSNINHPALKELMAAAPGSYQHSIMVGTLAEAAALKVDANPLYCRVASYYHDIGKSKEPEYFIENCTRGKLTVHEKIDDPFVSAEKLISHVSEGVKLAKEYRLGRRITEIIKQHHGTSLSRFFYVKAKEKAPPGKSVEEANFRYRGPKPQSLDSAIIMLADSCEAAVRSLGNPTPENIKEMVRKVCGSILRDGQLDESGISLKQFKDTTDTFLEQLITIYHQRIPYPEEKNKFPKLIFSKNNEPKTLNAAN